jgi:hypothetical protein
MKFLITYSYPADKFVPVVKAWGSLTPQERAKVGDGAKKIGQWHDVVAGGPSPLSTLKRISHDGRHGPPASIQAVRSHIVVCISASTLIA